MTNTAILIIPILRHLHIITAPARTTVLIQVHTTARGRVHTTAQGQVRTAARGQARTTARGRVRTTAQVQTRTTAQVQAQIIIHRQAAARGAYPQKRKEAQIIIIIHPILSVE